MANTDCPMTLVIIKDVMSSIFFYLHLSSSNYFFSLIPATQTEPMRKLTPATIIIVD